MKSLYRYLPFSREGFFNRLQIGINGFGRRNKPMLPTNEYKTNKLKQKDS